MLLISKIIRAEAGFTLLEVIVSLAIIGILGVGVFAAFAQIRNVSSINNAQMNSVKQVENASRYLNRDIQMAQSVEKDGTDEDYGAYWLKLSWTTWDDAYKHKVLYQLSGENLVRTAADKGPEDSEYAVISSGTVAAGITDYSAAAPNPTATPVEKHWTLELTSTGTSGLKQTAESRELRIIPRPGS